MTRANTKTKTVGTDRIEKELLLRAPRTRVWRALTDAREFDAWFGIKLDGPFVVGKTTRGKLDIEPYKHATLELTVVELVPESRFSYRWHPFPMDPKIDYASESTTLCEFRLEDAPGGTRLSIVESGFDAIPASRRDEAYRMHEGGWAEQLENIARHVA